MEGDATIGIAGSKLVDPDGILQEAGGIIWSDGQGWNFGRFDDPEKPEYNYVKEVDYISGASIMVRRELWQRVGGFDERYVPAYYEDTDLAFEARRLGYRVVYQPRSVVVHFEGKSHGTSTSSGIKSYQVTNQKQFAAKWQELLKGEHFPAGTNIFRARDRSRDKKAVLVIDHYVPTRDRDAGSFFMYSLLQALASLGYRVTFWPENLYRHEPYCSELQQLGVEVIYGQCSFDRYLGENGGNFDAAILTRNHVAINFIDTVRRHVPKVIYHDPDLEFVREQRRLELEGGAAVELAKIKEREFYLFRNCDVVGIHSPVEKAIIEKELPGIRVEVIPLPISETAPTDTPFAARDGLFFVGGTHPPNADALAYFIKEIMPLLRARMPDISFTVAGQVNRGVLNGLDMTGVEFAGFVPDLRPLYDQARVFVAPLRYGAGIKGKILEAMNYGLPVVTTAVGAEGIGLNSGENVMIADTAEAFAEAVLELYEDEAAWNRLCRGGRRHVEEHFSQDALRNTVDEVMQSLFER
jgi:glycosyltransferase involved in cell wall biosynthesis